MRRHPTQTSVRNKATTQVRANWRAAMRRSLAYKCEAHQACIAKPCSLIHREWMLSSLGPKGKDAGMLIPSGCVCWAGVRGVVGMVLLAQNAATVQIEFPSSDPGRTPAPQAWRSCTLLSPRTPARSICAPQLHGGLALSLTLLDLNKPFHTSLPKIFAWPRSLKSSEDHLSYRFSYLARNGCYTNGLGVRQRRSAKERGRNHRRIRRLPLWWGDAMPRSMVSFGRQSRGCHFKTPIGVGKVIQGPIYHWRHKTQPWERSILTYSEGWDEGIMEMKLGERSILKISRYEFFDSRPIRSPSTRNAKCWFLWDSDYAYGPR